MIDPMLQYFTDDDTHKRLHRFKDFEPQTWNYKQQEWHVYEYLGKYYYDEIWVSPITPEKAAQILIANNPCTPEEAQAILASDVPENNH